MIQIIFSILSWFSSKSQIIMMLIWMNTEGSCNFQLQYSDNVAVTVSVNQIQIIYLNFDFNMATLHSEKRKWNIKIFFVVWGKAFLDFHILICLMHYLCMQYCNNLEVLPRIPLWAVEFLSGTLSQPREVAC